MPYIKENRRENLYDGKYIKVEAIENAGDIQYAIAEMVDFYLRYGPGKFNYQKCNDIMGALAGAQMEFYRKVVAPYEDEKILENGGLYDLKAYKKGTY
jgi:hypothetical protein